MANHKWIKLQLSHDGNTVHVNVATASNHVQVNDILHFIKVHFPQSAFPIYTCNGEVKDKLRSIVTACDQLHTEREKQHAIKVARCEKWQMFLDGLQS